MRHIKRLPAIKKLMITLLICLTSFLLCSCLEFSLGVDHLFGSGHGAASKNVKVSLLQSEGITARGELCAEVSPGEDAVFNFTVNEGFIYLGNTADAEYLPESGKLTVKNVRYPLSVQVLLLDTRNMHRLELEANTASTLRHDGAFEWFDRGDTVSVSAAELTAYDFVGWSTGGYLSDGGELVCNTYTYSFNITEGLKLYANYTPTTIYTVLYHANGGIVAESGAESLEVQCGRSSQYACRNTLHSNGTFVRDGYIAVGYSTVPADFEDYGSVNDIPGFSNMGGVCYISDETCFLELYVVWAKADESSDFLYYIEDGAVTVTDYCSQDDIAVIPEAINGLPVTRIAEGAFAESDIRCAVLPKSMEKIDEGAFSGCRQLSQIVFFDGVYEVSDLSFSECEGLSTIVVNAQMLPVYSGYITGSFCIKYELLRASVGQKKLIVVSGSSSLSGLNSEMLSAQYPEYSVINYGTNASTSMLFYLYVVSKYSESGDIIIHAGEYMPLCLGDNKITAKLFRGNEQCYDIFRDVDMTDFVGFWDAFAEYQTVEGRLSRKEREYQIQCIELNRYGDQIDDRSEQKIFTLGSYNFYRPANILSAQNAERLNAAASVFEQKGASLLYSFPVLDELAEKEASKNNPESYSVFYDYFTEILNYTVISKPEDYLFDHTYFYDSAWHCTNEGAVKRTEQLILDLNAYLGL